MTSTETTAQFLVNCPSIMSAVEIKSTVNSPDEFVKWDLILQAKPKGDGNYQVCVEATAFSTKSPFSTKFVQALIKVVQPASCEDRCLNWGCSFQSTHSLKTLAEEPLNYGFHFKANGELVTAHSTLHYRVSNTILPVQYFVIDVHLTHFRTALKKHPLLPSVTPCIMTNLKTLLDSGELSDVTFVVGGEEIKAHAVILGAASDVFKAMFQHDTEDKRTGRITVEDVDPVVFKEMLRCVYTNSEPKWRDGDEDFLVGLLFLAEKYLLESLRGQCQLRIVATLTVENVVSRLRTVSLVSPSLVPLLEEPFVRLHLKEILSSGSWKTLMKEDVALAAKLMFGAMKS